MFESSPEGELPCGKNWLIEPTLQNLKGTILNRNLIARRCRWATNAQGKANIEVIERNRNAAGMGPSSSPSDMQ